MGIKANLSNFSLITNLLQHKHCHCQGRLKKEQEVGKRRQGAEIVPFSKAMSTLQLNTQGSWVSGCRTIKLQYKHLALGPAGFRHRYTLCIIVTVLGEQMMLLRNCFLGIT